MSSVDTTRDPDTMTAEERRGEVASILAWGLVRAVRAARARMSERAESPRGCGGTCLDLRADLPLSVAPRPAGSRAGL